MKKSNQGIIDLITRYLLMIVLPLNGLWLFYFIFTPLTVYPVYFILNLLADVSMFGNIIVINRTLPIEFIDACIAGAAYYLLVILNLSTRGIELRKRIYLLVFSFATFLLFNLARIFILIGIVYYDYYFFDVVHAAFWYSISTIFVIITWFIGVKIFNVRDIPFYSDFKFIKNSIKR